MYIGIKNNKIYDICSDLRNKRDNSINNRDYIKTSLRDLFVGDTWDFDNNISLKDSSQRFEEAPKSELELKIIELENRIKKLEVK